MEWKEMRRRMYVLRQFFIVFIAANFIVVDEEGGILLGCSDDRQCNVHKGLVCLFGRCVCRAGKIWFNNRCNSLTGM